MNDKIFECAQRDNCILAITPDYGGSWLSPCKSGVAIPSSTPRNFFDDPCTWYDFYIKSAKIGTNNYSMKIIARIDDVNGYIWSISGAQTIFSIQRYTPNIIFGMQPGTANYSQNTINNVSSGIHEFLWVKNGSNASWFMDGNQINNIPSVIGETQWLGREIPRSNSGSILFAELRDETINKVIWNYPSEAEKLNLISKSNIITDNGLFSPASLDISAPTYVETKIDFQGYKGDFTLFFTGIMTKNDPISTGYNPIFGQGFWFNGQSVTTIIANFGSNNMSRFAFNVGFTRENGTTTTDANANMTDIDTDTFFKMYGNRPISIAGVLNRTAKKVYLYIDGILIKTGDVVSDAYAIRDYREITTIASRPVSLMANNTRNRNYSCFSFYNALAFNSALTDNEIKQLSFTTSNNIYSSFKVKPNSDFDTYSFIVETSNGSTIYWGDGTSEYVQGNSVTLAHKYTDLNKEYTIKIEGHHTRFYQTNSTYASLVTELISLYYGMTSLNRSFSWCSNLIKIYDTCEIPINITTMYYAFNNCSGLKKFGKGITLHKCVNNVYMHNAFSDMTSLEEIPETLLMPLYTTDASQMFSRNTSLSKIADNFYYPPIALQLDGFFGQTAITEAPKTPFPETCTSLASIFSRTKLVDVSWLVIPESVTNAQSMFHSVTTLINAGFNWSNSGISEHRYMFYGCSNLVTPPIGYKLINSNEYNYETFRHCGNMEMDITHIFDEWSTGTGTKRMIAYMVGCSKVTGTLPENILWNNTNIEWLETTGAFRNCTGISNYSDIPDTWK